MKKISVISLDYYNKNVIQRIAEKYGIDYMSAARAFLTSEVHAMIEDPKLEMWEFSERAVFDMWEVERITGDPRNSAHSLSRSLLLPKKSCRRIRKCSSSLHVALHRQIHSSTASAKSRTANTAALPDSISALAMTPLDRSNWWEVSRRDTRMQMRSARQ